MIKYLGILLLCTNIYASDIINGTTVLLEFDETYKDTKFIVDKKEIPLLKHPTKSNSYFALIPIAYKIKKDTLKLHHVKEDITLHVSKGNYKKETLHVSKNKVSPPKSVQDRIYTEYKEAMGIYNTYTKQRYWDKPFIHPLNSKITSEYGNARIFNGSLKSFHSGTDFRAKIGTSIIASNEGVVVIAKDRYYAGGSVVIDHGEGVYSSYYHLSEIDVKVGQKVTRSQVVGLSGDTGRVTGAHLHFAIMLFAQNINPLDFINKVNSLLK